MPNASSEEPQHELDLEVHRTHSVTYELTRMDENQKLRLLESVNLLIRHPEAQRLFESMLAVVNVAKLHPVELTGDAQALNALMHLRNTDEQAYDRVVGLVETKRQEAGYEPLLRPPSDKFDKTEYMRQFMDKKRLRQRRAAAIENMMRPERDALKGQARLAFMERQSNKWKAELDAKLEKARIAQGGRLSNDILASIRDQFWKTVDEQLDELETLAREEMRKPGRAKPDASISQLQKALEHDPYKK